MKQSSRQPASSKNHTYLDAEDKFYECLAGGARASMLVLALDVGLDKLLYYGPRTAEEICTQLEFNPLRGQKFLTILETLELVVAQTEDGTKRYASGPVLQAMTYADGDGGYFYREFMRYWRVAVERDMVSVLRGGPIPYEVKYPPQDTGDVALLHDWMRNGALLTLKVIERVFDFSKIGKMLDVAGGDATMACEITKKFTKPQITVFNIPKAAALGRANVERNKLEDRVSIHEGNFLNDPLPLGNFELVMFSRVLADWSPEVTQMLLNKAFAAMAPGGQLLVAEPFRDENPDLSIAWDHSYLPYDDFGDYAYKPTGDYETMMKNAGFVDVKHHPRTDTIHGVLIANKPAKT